MDEHPLPGLIKELRTLRKTVGDFVHGLQEKATRISVGLEADTLGMHGLAAHGNDSDSSAEQLFRLCGRFLQTNAGTGR